MARYLLIGAVGGPNFGDELILLTWINIIRRRDPAANIICDGYNLVNLKKYVEGLADVVEEKESLWRIGWALKPESKTGIWADISIKSNNDENSKIIIECLSSLQCRKIDQIHIIGGGYINNIWPDNYMILLMARLLSWQTGARLIATGLGLIPSNERDNEGLRSILKTYDLVDVRDEESYKILNGINYSNIHYTGDDVLLLLSDDNYIYPIKKLSNKSFIFCLQNDLFKGDLLFYKIFNNDFLEFLNVNGFVDIVFAMAMSDDVSGLSDEFFLLFKKYNLNVITINPDELLRDGFPVSDEGIIITSRYHPHFLGALSGYKGIALSSMRYYNVKHKAVQDMGSNWKVIHFKDIFEDFIKVIQNLISEDIASYRQEDRNRFIEIKNNLVEQVIKRSECRFEFPIDVLRGWQSTISNLEAGKNKNHELYEQVNQLARKADIDRILIDDIEIQLENLKNKNNAIVNSLSWKITFPFRFVYNLFFNK